MQRVIVAICPHWGVHGDPSPPARRAAHQALVDAVTTVLGDPVAASDGEGVVAVIDDPAEAVDAALRLVASGVRHGAVGLGLGEVLVEEGAVHGAEAGRARRIAWRSKPGTVHVTPSFRQGLAIPDGIGVHRGGPDAENRVGFPVHQVADYRD